MDDGIGDVIAGFLKTVEFIVYGKSEIYYSSRTSVQQNIPQVCAAVKILTVENYFVIIKYEGG